MLKSCTSCGLLLQVYLGGSALKGLTDIEMTEIINRCSLVKCNHVCKPKKFSGFCLIHFQNESDAASFYYTYFAGNNLLCKSLRAIYVQEAIHSGVTADYVRISTENIHICPIEIGCQCNFQDTVTWNPTFYSNVENSTTEQGNLQINVDSITIDGNEDIMQTLIRLRKEVEVDEKALNVKYEKIKLLEQLTPFA
ncbi:hypothetical protein INT46_007584 [Mucor plumbeus]|uniref:Uncharacterized protein n=1 Tax=Mucor plumbeus TaxID=97098 RepID=A0A8H7VCN9_9FUNG|nr:hypothetical protein INT46_007584 [Mucor plumbeus]